MALRFAGTSLTIPLAGSAFTHSIQNPTGTAAAPTEWHWNHASGASAATSGLYRNGAPSTTVITLAACTAAGTADVFCRIPHSFMG